MNMLPLVQLAERFYLPNGYLLSSSHAHCAGCTEGSEKKTKDSGSDGRSQAYNNKAAVDWLAAHFKKKIPDSVLLSTTYFDYKISSGGKEVIIGELGIPVCSLKVNVCRDAMRPWHL